MSIRVPLIQRITLDFVTGCWNWNGSRTPEGYGRAYFQGKTTRAHRLAAYLWLRHPINSPLFVLHKCDNPSCFNPKHLYIGTALENNRDAVKRKRHRNSKKKSCKNGHPFDAKNTWMEAGRIRHCRECHRIKEAARRERKKKQEEEAQNPRLF